MESLKFIGMSICITTVITSIFTMLLPDGKLDNVIKFAITLFFLTSIITPFLDTDLQLDIKSLSNELRTQTNITLEQELTNTFIDLAKTNIEQELKTLLAQNSITSKKVLIDINISQDNSIYIEKVKIYIDLNSYDNDETGTKITSIINNEVGIIPEIILM